MLDLMESLRKLMKCNSQLFAVGTKRGSISIIPFHLLVKDGIRRAESKRYRGAI